MAITNVAAIQFSNEHIRTSADRLSRAFYLLQKLRNDWNSLTGTDAEKFAILGPSVTNAAGRISNFYSSLFVSKRLYDALGMNTLFPNDANEILVDGAPNDGRPVITGQDVRRVNARIKEFLAWLEKAAFDDLSINPINYNYLEHFLRINTQLVTPDWARIVAVVRAGELVTEYTTTNPSFLSHISKVAVNGGVE
jgi:hypothetical protein